MKNKNVVAATLAIGVLLGFLLTLAFIAVQEIPVANKDYFNTALIALIGLVTTSFGYYLGSSIGSAQKNELIARTASPPPGSGGGAEGGGGSDAGYIRLPLLFLIAAFACIVAVTGCATTGCATTGKAAPPSFNDSPQVLAGKSLLAVKSTIVVAATATDALCKAEKIPAEQCAQAKAAYELAKPAYDAAIDAYLLMVSTGGDPADFGRSITRVQTLAASLLTLAGGAQ